MLRLSTFTTDVLTSILSGLSTAANTAVTASDSVLVAIGKLQAQINGISTPTPTVTLSGDISGSGSTASSITTTLPTVNSNVGTFTNPTVTVNAKGLITSVTISSYNKSFAASQG
jgi:hypothetical protein